MELDQVFFACIFTISNFVIFLNFSLSSQHHNLFVQKYFQYRKNDLLVLNIAQTGAYIKLCEFLERKPLYERMPWENKQPEKST